jgi:hypothetical protein
MRPNSQSKILYRSRKYILLGVKKSENRPPEPKNSMSCDISIDQEFNIDQENT